MRAPPQPIPVPSFPPRLPWVNVAPLRMDKQLGRPVLVEFWDFCRVHSLRTLPYVKAWHGRYAAGGLRVIGVHAPGFRASADEAAVRAAVDRLEIEYPVLIDSELAVWREYENPGWPARYLFDQAGMLFHYHYGQGGYVETELAIQELLGASHEPLAPLRPHDASDAELVAPTEDQPGAWSGPYQAGSAWAVLEGHGWLTVNGERRRIEHPGAHLLVEHERHSAGLLALEAGDGLTCHAVCFEAGLAPARPSRPGAPGARQRQPPGATAPSVP